MAKLLGKYLVGVGVAKLLGQYLVGVGVAKFYFKQYCV